MVSQKWNAPFKNDLGNDSRILERVLACCEIRPRFFPFF